MAKKRMELPPPTVIDGVAMVPLTNGGFTTIDAEDLPLLGGHNWTGKPGHFTRYASRGLSGGGAVGLHRVIMEAPFGMVVDHIDGDGLNNRRANLRVVTKRENSQNRHPRVAAEDQNRRVGATGHRGIYLVQGEYRARIWRDDVIIEVGRSADLGTAVELRAWVLARLALPPTSDAEETLNRVRDVVSRLDILCPAAVRELLRAHIPSS